MSPLFCSQRTALQKQWSGNQSSYLHSVNGTAHPSKMFSAILVSFFPTYSLALVNVHVCPLSHLTFPTLIHSLLFHNSCHPRTLTCMPWVTTCAPSIAIVPTSGCNNHILYKSVSLPCTNPSNILFVHIGAQKLRLLSG